MRKKLVFVLGALVFMYSTNALAVDFVQKYARGKLLLKRKFYFDAIKELSIAVNKTARGKRHFGAHYYLAKAYYWLPDILKAAKMLEKAKALVKNNTQKNAYKQMLRQIGSLYGKLKIEPEVDPEEVGKLKIELKPKSEFSNSHKKRYYRLFDKRLKRQGGLLLNGRPMYLPKGEYTLRVVLPQCLKLKFSIGGKATTDLEIGAGGATAALQEGRSCQCPGGQKEYKDNNKQPYCACAPGSAWDKKERRCKIAKGFDPTPLIIAGGAGVVVIAGATVAAVLLTNNGGIAGVSAVNGSGSGNWKAW